MRTTNEEKRRKRKNEIMEKCYECYAEYGLGNVGIKALGKASGVTSAGLYVYFENLDDLIIQSTEHCMSKIEDDFMEKAPTSHLDLERFINEIPYWTAEHHGKKYRLMYQVYTNPKYREYGKKFFNGVDERYAAYARLLESKIGIPADVLRPMIFVFTRACVHYALFEDEQYLNDQIRFIKQSIMLFYEKYNSAVISDILKRKQAADELAKAPSETETVTEVHQ